MTVVLITGIPEGGEFGLTHEVRFHIFHHQQNEILSTIPLLLTPIPNKAYLLFGGNHSTENIGYQPLAGSLGLFTLIENG